MSEHSFADILADSIITIEGTSYESKPIGDDVASQGCTSLFFPGCSFINYAPSLAEDLYADLKARGAVDCVSLVCCGKILEYEEDIEVVKFPFQEELARRIRDKGIRRIVAACPNCVAELRLLMASYEDTASIEVVPLPVVLQNCGRSVGVAEVEAVLSCDGIAPVDSTCYPKVALHDSCPDRLTGEFAASTRAILPSQILVEKKHNRKNAICCGALANALGRLDVAESQAKKHGEEGVDARADSLVTYCMSCARFLGGLQDALPVHHYLEFMFGSPIDWPGTSPYLSYRFLFEEAHGTRDFCGAVPLEVR